MLELLIDGLTYYKHEHKRMRHWDLAELNTGNNTGKYIPYVGDTAVNRVTHGLYDIVHVDPHTGIATVQPSGKLDVANLWMYFDTNTTPTSVVVDNTFTVNGDAHYAMAYKGLELVESIGEVYDHMNVFDTDRIPLRRVNSNSHEPLAIYVVERWHTRENLVNGDIVTLVVYDTYDNIMTVRAFTLSDVSQLNDVTCNKQIRSVALVSPFMVDGDLIRRPITVGVDDLNFAVNIEYTDGTSALTGIDDPKVTLAGLDVVRLNNTALIHDIMLIYRTDGDPINGPMSSNGIITVAYHLQNYAPAKSYNHSLYIYPVYINNNEHYRIGGKLTLADRSAIIDVSDLLHARKPIVDELNILQTLEYYVDLNDIPYLPENHTVTKTTWVKLRNYGGQASPRWSSIDTEAVRPFKITSATGITHVTIAEYPKDWYDITYHALEPMILSGIEDDPPVATHVIFKSTLHGDKMVPIADLDKSQPYPELYSGDIIDLEFAQLLGNTTLMLAYLPIYIN